MSNLVPADEIEQIVGVPRHETEHWGRAVSETETVYMLHSVECKAAYTDLRDCPFSVLMDAGINADYWPKDTPIQILITEGRLSPVVP